MKAASDRKIRRDGAEFRGIPGAARQIYLARLRRQLLAKNYGPIVVAHNALKASDIAGKRIAVPGLKTTAYLTLKLYEPNFDAVVTAVRQKF